MKKIPFTLLFASAFLSASTLSAELIVYEGFDYQGGQLRDQAYGLGWSAGWTGAHQRVVEGESLASALGDTPATIGGHMTTPNGDWASERDLESSFASEPGTYWISILAANLTNEQMDVYGGVSFAPEEGGGGVEFIKIFSGENWSIKAAGRTETTSSPANNQPVFAVLRIVKSADPENDSVAVFVDPDLSAEPITPDAEITGVSIPQIEKVSVRTGNGERLFGFDEIRMGTTYDAVTPEAQE
ncbi:MAG: hypothetical protein ACFCU3_06890 [Verrucomicrobiales bacterium]